MDMDALRIFLNVQHSGSITAAANSHYMTQPALGKRIMQLEKELGVTLLNRGKGHSRAQLTPAGEAFSDIAQRMLMLYEQALELHNDPARQHLTVACIHSAHDRLMPQILAHLKAAHPNLCLTIEDHHTMEILQLVEHRRVDVGITHAAAMAKGLDSKLLYEESYRVIFRADHTAAVGSFVHPSELCAENGIFQVFDPEFEAWFNRWWQPYSIKVRVNATPTAESYFNTSKDWIIVPEAVARGMVQRGFVSHALSEPPPLHRVYMILNQHSQREGITWFCDAVKESIHNGNLI